VRLTIEIPDVFFHPHEVNVRGLDTGWRLDTPLTRRIGDTHFSSTPLVPLKAPSVVVDTEWNILFSRDYAIAHASIVNREPIMMDERLWSI